MFTFSKVSRAGFGIRVTNPIAVLFIGALAMCWWMLVLMMWLTWAMLWYPFVAWPMKAIKAARRRQARQSSSPATT